MIKNRLVLFLLFFFLIVGCKDSSVDNNVSVDNSSNAFDLGLDDTTHEYVDDNPIRLSLYLNKRRVSEFVSPMKIYTDIVSLECYYTEDDSIIDGNFKNVFNSYYGKYEDISNYKIGYRVKFDTTDGNFDVYIYRPRDVESYFNYIQTYLYDDIHQNSSWYSHLEDANYTDDNRLTSIKFTASTYIDKVISDIEVTAFTYCDKDIDNGIYMGNSKYTVIIKKG